MSTRLLRAGTALLLGGSVVALGVNAVQPASARPPLDIVTSISGATAASIDVTDSSSTALTSSHVTTTNLAVSQDGDTALYGGRATGVDAASYAGIGPARGITRVHRNGEVITSQTVATWWSLPPVLSADGSTVWWVYLGKVYRWVGGTTTLLAPTLFVPQKGEMLTAFVVSPDGTKGAALYRSATGARLLAASFATGRSTAYFEHRFPVTTGDLAPDCFTWADDSTILYRPTSQPTHVSWSSLAVGGFNGYTTSYETNAWYYPRPLGSQWWIWDTVSPGTVSPWRYRVVDTLLVTGAPVVRTATTQLYSPYSTQLTPSLAVPPALPSVATIGSAAVGHLTLSTSSVLYGKRALDIAYGQYLAAMPGFAIAKSGPVLAGALEYSTDKVTWKILRWNAANIYNPWPGTKTAANGYVNVKRSVWLRYHYRGDPFVTPIISPVRRLTVTPLLTVRISKPRPGGSRVVSGTVTRGGGTTQLQVLRRGHYMLLTTAPISRTGHYTFGWHRLGHGTYRVLSVGDSVANQARSVFVL